MLGIAEYWKAVREKEAELPDFVIIISTEDKALLRSGGVTTEVSRSVAAKALVQRTHKLATQAEVAAHKERERRTREDAIAKARKDAGITVVTLPASTKGKK